MKRSPCRRCKITFFFNSKRYNGNSEQRFLQQKLPLLFPPNKRQCRGNADHGSCACRMRGMCAMCRVWEVGEEEESERGSGESRRVSSPCAGD